MEVLYPRCAGLDVHKDTVVACVRIAEGGPARKETRTFKTTTSDLLNLSAWLSEKQCRHVVMEATGIYWRPVWQILSDGEFELVLANAAHVKNVPGRKSDAKDCDWLSDLMAHGLIRGSFVPDGPTQELRALLRTRKQLAREAGSHIQRLQKTLESANIKLDSVISDILGKSGRAMIEAMIAGETDPEKLAGLADRRIKAPYEVLKEALLGRITKHHRFMLQLHLRQIDAIDAAIICLDEEVEANLDPFRKAVSLLKTMHGVRDVGAQAIAAEIGCDMSRFPSDDHLLSWAGMCPRSDESAGKRRSTRMRKGAPWLKPILIECAWAAKRKKGSYFQAQFNRVCARRGPKKAIGAVAASMLRAAYHMLKNNVPYHDLGADHFNRRNKTAHARRLLKSLNNLGYVVQLTPVAA
jgi:transposase